MTDANLNQSSPNVFIPILKPLPVTALRTTPNVTPVLDSKGAEARCSVPSTRAAAFFLFHSACRRKQRACLSIGRSCDSTHQPYPKTVSRHQRAHECNLRCQQRQGLSAIRHDARCIFTKLDHDAVRVEVVKTLTPVVIDRHERLNARIAERCQNLLFSVRVGLKGDVINTNRQSHAG